MAGIGHPRSSADEQRLPAGVCVDWELLIEGLELLFVEQRQVVEDEIEWQLRAGQQHLDRREGASMPGARTLSQKGMVVAPRAVALVDREAVGRIALVELFQG